VVIPALPLDRMREIKKLVSQPRFEQEIPGVQVTVSDNLIGVDKGKANPEGPRFPDNRHMKVVRLSALRTGHLYPPENISGTHLR
jgi:hypothetical protein